MADPSKNDESLFEIYWYTSGTKIDHQAGMPPADAPVESGNIIGRRSLWSFLTTTVTGLLLSLCVGLWIVFSTFSGAQALYDRVYEAFSSSQVKPPVDVTPPVVVTPKTNPEEDQIRAMKAAHPDFQLSAEALGSILDVENETEVQKMMQRYAGKVILLHGTICEVFEEGVVLTGPLMYGQASRNLRCLFLDKMALSQLRVGQSVLFKGRFERATPDDLQEVGRLVDGVLVP